MMAIRSFLFYLLMLPVAGFFGLLACVIFPLPFLTRYRIIVLFNYFSIWWLKVSCGVKYHITGADNIPNSPCVVLAKHQSTWETFFLQYYFAPLSTILKRELLRIPFFGWGLAALRPIPIDRSNPRDALRQIKTMGVRRLEEGNNVLVFPEGTRTPAGKVGNYARGGADIARAANMPIIPVAHNAGLHWPMNSLTKKPGTIEVVIGQPINPEGKTSRELTQQVQDWIENEISQMNSID